MATILQTTFSNYFACMGIVAFSFKLHWNSLLRDRLIIIASTVSDDGLAEQATSHYLNQLEKSDYTAVRNTPRWLDNFSMLFAESCLFLFFGYDKISSANSSNAFSTKCPKSAYLTCFTKSKYRQNEENQQTMTKTYAVDNAVGIHLHVKFQAIPPMHSEENRQPPKFDLFHYAYIASDQVMAWYQIEFGNGVCKTAAILSRP